jgi:hypothetical protein
MFDENVWQVFSGYETGLLNILKDLDQAVLTILRLFELDFPSIDSALVSLQVKLLFQASCGDGRLFPI